MKKISSLVTDNPKVLRDIQRRGDWRKPQIELPPQAIAIVNDLFKELAGIYHSTWHLVMRTDATLAYAKLQWSQTLFEHSVTTELQLAEGLSRARMDTNAYLPKASVFCDWCQGIDEAFFVEAFRRLIRNETAASLAEKVTRREVGYRCRSLLPENQAMRLFRSVLHLNIHKSMRSELAEPRPLLDSSCEEDFSKYGDQIESDEAKKFMQRMKRIQQEKRVQNKRGS
ncbi:hypothetical protein F9L16_23465 [Agarivorans sp. B2Z047]|uniref:replication protein P n=1 Tax=Agarivorans sp. B2Z047 TaxID=2652721 RepID=UPI00128C7951|nr:replication protein P [Agarivorans sp. B2Z047]MPW31916.1 hypothetical protein [Agarivorans sp. B2Z047]UQN44860.1 hypothetical protein LQZ07_10465 [Agarivorans sp. B2Z047]